MEVAMVQYGVIAGKVLGGRLPLPQVVVLVCYCNSGQVLGGFLELWHCQL